MAKQQMTLSITRFKEATKNLGQWATLEEILDACNDADFWTNEFYESAEIEAKKALVRRLIKQDKDESGFPSWANLAIQTDDGEKHIYKQEVLFDKEDYKQVISYWSERKEYAANMEHGYIQRAMVKYPEQQWLNFGAKG